MGSNGCRYRTQWQWTRCRLVEQRNESINNAVCLGSWSGRVITDDSGWLDGFCAHPECRSGIRLKKAVIYWKRESSGTVQDATGSLRFNDLGEPAQRTPILSASVFIGVLALIGIPPLSGFSLGYLFFGRSPGGCELTCKSSRLIFVSDIEVINRVR